MTDSTTTQDLAPRGAARAGGGWSIAAIVAGVLIGGAGTWGVARALTAWAPCMDGQERACLALQYEENPLLDPVPFVWVWLSLAVCGIAIAAFAAKAPVPVRIGAAWAALVVGLLNVITDYVLTVGQSADDGPGFGVPMMSGLLLAGLCLVLGGTLALQRARTR